MGRYDKLVSGDKPAFERRQPTTDVGTKEPVVVPPKVPSVVPTDVYSYVDIVRKAVKWPGKEGANLRLTQEEVAKLKSIVRHFEDKGYYTDRTQLTRIALNYAMYDFEQHGDKSLLAEIMERINTY